MINSKIMRLILSRNKMRRLMEIRTKMMRENRAFCRNKIRMKILLRSLRRKNPYQLKNHNKKRKLTIIIFNHHNNY